MEDKIVPFNKDIQISLKLKKYRYNCLYDIAIEEFKERNRREIFSISCNSRDRDRSRLSTCNILIFDLEYEKKEKKMKRSITPYWNHLLRIQQVFVHSSCTKSKVNCTRNTHAQIYSHSLNYHSMSLEERAATTNIPINLPRKKHHRRPTR